MPNNGTAVGSPTFTAAKFGNGLSGTSDANYVTLPSGTLTPTYTAFTIEMWLKVLTTGAIQIAFSQGVTGGANPFWFGMLANGHFGMAYFGVGSPLDSGVNIGDGAWHHCVVQFTGGRIQLYADGAYAGDVANPGSTLSATSVFLGRYQETGYGWPGSIDEVAFFNTARYSGSYTVPSAPYTGTETSIRDLYHLQADASDSVGAATTILPNNPAILYSPFNTATSSSAALLYNDGAYFRTIFSGTSISLQFNTSANAAPYPELWVAVDGQGRVKYTLGAGNPSISIGGLDGSRNHLVEVFLKSTSTGLTRWSSSSQTVVTLTAIALDSGSVVVAPRRRTKNILVFGDSITAGSNVVNSTLSPDTDRCDARVSYASQLATAMDAEVGIVGWAAQGISVGGLGSVPAFPSAYALQNVGVSRSFASPAPDLVIYNFGTNDGTASITSAYAGVISAIIAAAPSAKHLVLRPFNGNEAANVAAVPAAFGNGNVTYVDTTGWWSSSDSADGVHPYDYAHIALIAPKLLPYVTAALYPTGRSYSFS